MRTERASLLRLFDATNALLAAVACHDLDACERALRERDVALATLVRESARAPVTELERATLARVARASAEAEARLAAELAELAAELRGLRGVRAALPRARGGEARSLARA